MHALVVPYVSLVIHHHQGGGGPFYVRSYDIGQCVDDDRWVIVMEYLDADTEVCV